jgi:hypothetical protein
MREPEPLVEFFLLYPDAPLPEPASNSVRGSLPSRAVRLCQPILAASAFGWYVFPPVDFALRWDGHATEWSLLEPDNTASGWQSLSGGVEGFCPEAETVLAEVPAARQHDLDIFANHGGRVNFIDADPRAENTLEIITGVLARTSPGWVLLARGVPNWPHRAGYDVLEGVLETDWYRSYVPTMIRLLEPGRIVRFYRSVPIMVVQAVPRAALTASAAPVRAVRGIAELPDDVWAEFVAMRRAREDQPGRGIYRSRSRAFERSGLPSSSR